MNKVDIDKRVDTLGIKLPHIAEPIANYVPVVQVGNMLYLAGNGPMKLSGDFITGKVGKDLTVQQGYDASRLTGINILAVLKTHLGTLNRVKRVVKAVGMVNAVDTFEKQPQVIDGFSDFMVEIFGDDGKHARSAVGMSSLPMNIAVEIEVLVEVYSRNWEH
jgi:enamine deaminase RidA (YjgF/YER057c/UK114 family)